MAATAAQPMLARSASGRNYQGTPDSRHRRTASSARASVETGTTLKHEPSTGSSTHYARSQSTSTAGAPASSLNGVARRDQETTNLPAVGTGGRRSSSRDQSHVPPSPGQRRDAPPSSHYRDGSRSSRQRYSTDAPRAAPPPSTHTTMNTSQRPPHGGESAVATPPNKPPSRRSLEMPETGVWDLIRTIGAGSMGKVKLARNRITGEQCALKIVPRQSTEEYRSQRERERADHSKDVRTAREAAIVKLLKHPYICGLKDVLQTNHHWYMLFEYVNGGQMLDYIISHGRLKEKHARKFARQIGSALDYCHKNSIVHRDLKIENILISKTGDIKIIDFGLSNLYSPGNLLKTFCGSLYFAAPELLQAQHYDGPEVDVWSFGIVLYVLVCGKVPFDDQSMPQLHAKIKKGQVDYPNWLSAECKHLISRMLVTDRKARAPLSEIMTHPWMIKGYTGALENFLPVRDPLKLPLDEEVIEGMTGFEFGTQTDIKDKLTDIIESERYQLAVRLSRTDTVTQTPGSEKRRGMLDFYKRRSSTTSRDSIHNVSTEMVNTFDPLSAFAKELSIYYLAREKLQRERAPQKTVSSTMLPATTPTEPLQLPELAEPKAAVTNASTYEQPGEKPTGGRSRPRARTQGEDEVAAAAENLQTGPQTSPVTSAPAHTPKKESMAGGLLRRLSTRRTKDRNTEKTEVVDATSPALKPPVEAAVPRRGWSVRRSRTRETSASPDMRAKRGDHLAPPSSSNPMTRAGQKILGRSSSVNSAEWRRHKISKDDATSTTDENQNSTSNLEPPPTAGSEQSSVPKVKISEPSAQVPEGAATPTKPSVLHRSVTSARTKSLGHARRESIQARRAKRNESRNAVGADVPEETEKELLEAEGGEAQSEMKPVFLKGLFSVSTTSSKPLAIIRADIIRVLNELNVDFQEIKGGFSCQSSPDADLSNREQGQGKGELAGASVEKTDLSSPGTRGSMSRRRISFHGIMGGSRDSQSAHGSEPKTPRSPSKARGSPSDVTDDSDTERERERERPSFARSNSKRRSLFGRPAGETTTHVESDTGETLLLRFEIFVVKVPLFTLHGIQFKKVSGGTWSYKEMAQRILNRLRL